MGINSAVAVTEGHLSEDTLAILGLLPEDASILVERVLTVPAEERICVVTLPSHTLIVDGGDQLAQTFDAPRVDLPGTWHVGFAVSSAGFADYRAFEDGELVRQARYEDGELLTRGDPVLDESAFLIADEVDGDLLIQDLPVAAGVTAGGRGFDLFALQGQAYRSKSRDSESAAATERPARKGLFKRLFGA